MDWRQKRKFTILSVIMLVVASIGFSYYEKYKTIPTCFDNRQNGDEEGVDCGGSCIPCKYLALKDVDVYWAKYLNPRRGSYDAVAYVKNPNLYYGSLKLNYEFELYDESNALVAVRNGSTFIHPNESVTIIEPDLRTNLPVRTVNFKIMESAWILIRDQLPVYDISLVRRNYSVVANVRGVKQSVVSADIFNNTLETISRANVSILLFDKDRNIIGAGRTIVESLNPGETREISFSWPEEIRGTVDSIEGHVRVNQLSRLPQ